MVVSQHDEESVREKESDDKASMFTRSAHLTSNTPEEDFRFIGAALATAWVESGAPFSWDLPSMLAPTL